MLLSMHVSGIVAHQRARGNEERTWGMAGFSGFKCGQVEYGVRGDEFIVRLMSEAAALSWRRCYELADSITRLDVQTSVEMHKDCQPLVWSYYRRANRKSAKKKRGPLNHVILGNDGGATLYCGERTSNRFGRCYAKGPQSGDAWYKTVLRFEVQYNSRLAKLVSRQLARAKSPLDFAHGRAVRFFEERIGQLPVRTEHIYNDSCPREASDCDKKLLWLAKAVSPSVQFLLRSGRRDETLRALGIEVGGPSVRSE